MAGSLILPLGGIHYFFAILGGVALWYGVSRLLNLAYLEDRKSIFTFGLLLAILGGMWAKYTLDNYSFNITRLLLTSLLSGFGLYLQSLCYTALARVYHKELLELGGILLVIGSATFWFYIGFIPLSVGVILIVYSFWRW
ncbi:MAG: hypothetical protein N3C57_03420 [Aquificaceae bacterium]|nr:hypothetical protein [Aquificaceae bacterium]MCX8076065.1 hypothetical protein [Aquificaceae bacterium]